jgi:hypothetical protein
MRRCRPCRSCGHPTPLGELVETHVHAGQTAKPGWWVSADRVIWLCRRCAAASQAHPSPLARREVNPLRSRFLNAKQAAQQLAVSPKTVSR